MSSSSNLDNLWSGITSNSSDVPSGAVILHFDLVPEFLVGKLQVERMLSRHMYNDDRPYRG